MIFQPDLALRILLSIFVVAVAQFPLVCAAQTAAKNQAQIREIDQRLSGIQKEIDQRLSGIQKEMDSFKASPKITEDQKKYLGDITAAKTELENSQNRMREIASNVANNQLTLSYNYFQIFTAMVAIAAVFAAGVGFVVRRVLYEELKGRIEKEVVERIQYEAELVRANTFLQQSYAWYQHYEVEYQELLAGKTRPDLSRELTIEREIKLARNLSEAGLEVCTHPSIVDRRESDRKAWEVFAFLTNLWVYSRTAELVCQRMRGESIDTEVLEVLPAAHQCILLAGQKPAESRRWHDLHETAAFAMIQLGDQKTKEEGRAVIRNIFAGKTPAGTFKPPGRAWFIDRCKEYFPSQSDGTITDPLGLEPITKPCKLSPTGQWA